MECTIGKMECTIGMRTMIDMVITQVHRSLSPRQADEV